MENDRIERIRRRVTAALPRRKVATALLSVSLLKWLAPRDARAGRETAHLARQDGEPGPAPPKCSKLGGECFVNSDCCEAGARCKRAGRNTCVCKAGRAKCGPICCAAGRSCCDICADLQTDPNNCGACFTVCATNETCVAGSCTA